MQDRSRKKTHVNTLVTVLNHVQETCVKVNETQENLCRSNESQDTIEATFDVCRNDLKRAQLYFDEIEKKWELGHTVRIRSIRSYDRAESVWVTVRATLHILEKHSEDDKDDDVTDQPFESGCVVCQWLP